MPYLSSRQHNHTEPQLRRTRSSHGVALTAVLMLLCAAALFCCGVTIFGTLTGA